MAEELAVRQGPGKGKDRGCCGRSVVQRKAGSALSSVRLGPLRLGPSRTWQLREGKLCAGHSPREGHICG